MKGQEMDMSQRLISQGAWFLFSLRTEEKVGDEVLTQVEFFKKDDISSLFFDHENKLYTVFSKYSSDVYEDRWKLVDDDHFVMVSPTDGSSQIVEILEIDSTKLVLRNCGDIENGTSCSLYTYFSTKGGWLPDSEINNLNTVGIVEVDEMTP
jgi:hypothetical protein